MAVSGVEPAAFDFACPLCRHPLRRTALAVYTCPEDGRQYPCVDGIWRFLPHPLAEEYDHFVKSYEAIRREEGWGSKDPDYYRSLPFTYGSRRYQDIWHVRVGSYRTFMEQIIRPLAGRLDGHLRVLDLGAGTGWLSYRLAQAGHHSAAVDLITNQWDGLGAWRHYPPDAPFVPVQATFDHLPFAGASCDLVVFNGAIHYAPDYDRTLKQALQLLQPGGQIVIMDSPYYAHAASGRQMVQEKEVEIRQAYGLDMQTLPAENFLTPARLTGLSRTLEIRWQIIKPFRGFRWRFRYWRHRLRGRREPATFPIIVGQP